MTHRGLEHVPIPSLEGEVMRLRDRTRGRTQKLEQLCLLGFDLLGQQVLPPVPQQVCQLEVFGVGQVQGGEHQGQQQQGQQRSSHYQYILNTAPAGQEQKFMLVAPTLRSYSQLTAVLYLWSSTACMVLALLSAFFGSFFGCLWDLLLLAVELVTSRAIIILVCWLILLRTLKNGQIVAFISFVYGVGSLQRQFRCDKCSRPASEVIMPRCLHTFHEECLPFDQAYIDLDICSRCLQTKKQKNNRPHLITKILGSLRQKKMVFYLVLAAALYGLYGFLRKHWSLVQLMTSTAETAET